ncbi:MAG: hypothetical protein VST72_05485 [Nitrospirota bacterium]|nr:hypothetical protein [Nitrospirota bacterium]
MFKKLYETFRGGIEKIRWFATILSERIKIEIAVIKLLYESKEMDRKKDELLKKIGRRVYDLKGHTDRNIFRDRLVVDTLAEIEEIETGIDELKQQASGISGLED